MLAVRKLPAQTVGKWQSAIAEEKRFEELPVPLIQEWLDGTGSVSIYEIDNESFLPTISMALTMLGGDGPKGAAFLVVDMSSLKGLEIHKTTGETKAKSVDERHRDVKLRTGANLRQLIEAFLGGEVLSATLEHATDRAIDAFRTNDYDVASMGGKLRSRENDTGDQRVCNSAMKMAAKGKLELNVPQAS